jgi:hypothetical protein
MITPVVHEISHDQAVALQRQWQQSVAASLAKASEAKR